MVVGSSAAAPEAAAPRAFLAGAAVLYTQLDSESRNLKAKAPDP